MLENYIIGYGLNPNQAKIIMSLIDELKQLNKIIKEEVIDNE